MPLPVFSLMLVVFGLTTGEFVIAGMCDVAVKNIANAILVNCVQCLALLRFFGVDEH